MLSSGRNPRAVQMSLIKKFSFSILLSLALLLVAGVLAGRAEASSSRGNVGNIDVGTNNYDNYLNFVLSYDPNAPQDPGFYGNSFDIFGLNYGGNIDSMTGGWYVDSIVTNANGSKDYHLVSIDPDFSIQGGQNLSFNLFFAPQNGNPVPQGLGSMPLDSLINVQSGYAGGLNYQAASVFQHL